MKALEVATVLNNDSLEGKIRENALAKEKDALATKVSQVEGDTAAGQFLRSVTTCCYYRKAIGGCANGP